VDRPATLTAVRSALKRATRLPGQARSLPLLRVVLGAGGRLSVTRYSVTAPFPSARTRRRAPDLALVGW
jgi:hypothetical protein